MDGHGGPGGSRVLVVLDLIRLGVEPSDEEEASDGGREEDEDHPQRAHLLSCGSPKERIKQMDCWWQDNGGKERKKEEEEEGKGNPMKLGTEPNQPHPFLLSLIPPT